jgi:hypothetical protein
MTLCEGWILAGNKLLRSPMELCLLALGAIQLGLFPINLVV